ELSGDLKLWGPAGGKALASRRWDAVPTAVAYSPDGKYLAVAAHNDAVTTCDAATLEHGLLFRGQTEWKVPWTSVAFSADGKWLAAGSSTGVVRVWHAATAEEFFSKLTPSQAGVSGLTFCGPDARFLAAATADNTVQVWVSRTGIPAFSLRGHTRAVKAVACSPDGRCLASAGLGRTGGLWDLTRRPARLT